MEKSDWQIRSAPLFARANLSALKDLKILHESLFGEERYQKMLESARKAVKDADKAWQESGLYSYD